MKTRAMWIVETIETLKFRCVSSVCTIKAVATAANY